MFWYLMICVFFGAIGNTFGSKIQFSVNPTEVTPPLTQSLHMKCSLQDTSIIVGKRDVNETPEAMAHVSSIIITRNEDEHVALVSQFESARALVDSGQLVVTGDVSGAHDDKAYIRLSWSDPSGKQAGFYKCEINAVDSMGHSVVFSTGIDIPGREPSLTDVVQNVNQMQGLYSEIADLKSQIEDLKSNYTSPHLESGTVHCRPSHSAEWPLLSGSRPFFKERGVTTEVVFKKPYRDIPSVNIGIILVDTFGDKNTRTRVELVSVTKTGFKANCISWDDSKTYRLWFDWLSYLE